MAILVGPANLDHRHLRSALDFAVAIAAAGQRLKPALPFPDDLRPFLKQARLPGGALGRIRRTVDGRPDFRERLAAVATPELVDPIGLEWLRREPGWIDRVAALVDDAVLAENEQDAASALKRAERRREAAEQVAMRSRAEVAQLQEAVAERDRMLAEIRTSSGSFSAEVVGLRAELAEARQAARHAQDRATAARQRVEPLERERDEVVRRAEVAAAQRDAILAARVEWAGAGTPGSGLSDVRGLAESARALAARLAALAGPPPARRVPLAVPGAVARDPRKAADHLLRSAGVTAFVDGYNVAKLTWPDLALVDQREHLLDAVDALVRRVGVELTVVFDGADVTGSHARRRRLARVTYSPGGISADDVIRREVARADPARPVVVVTNDGAIRRYVAAAGANLIASDVFATLALS